MSASGTTSLPVVFGRLFWMMAGPVLLLLTLYSIVTSGTGWWTIADLLYFVILWGMLLGKWVEFHGGNPQTTTGEPATKADLRRYVLITTILVSALWVLANLIGNHLLGN